MATNNILLNYSRTIENMDIPNGKKKILIVAMELFAENGYNGTSTAQISERSGMSQGSIFKHFKTKDQLLLDIITPVSSILTKDFINECKKYDDLDSLVRFIVYSRFQLITNNQPLFKILIQEVAINDNIRKVFQDIFTSFLVNLIPIIKKCNITSGEIDPSLSPLAISRIFIGQLIPLFIQSFVLNAPTDIDAELEITVAQILKLLKK